MIIYYVIGGVLGLVFLVGLTYVLARTASYAYFRTLAEYDRKPAPERANGEDHAKG